MRVNRERLRSERGAAGVILALVSVALIGMMGLSVDGGALFLKHRGMRNAADAAALAAAQSCAKGEGLTAANSQADLLAVSNVTNAVRVSSSYSPSCVTGSGTVTVTYRASQPLYFSQVVGVSSPKTVVAQTTAKWGGVSAADHVVPLMVRMDLSAGANGSPCNLATIQVGDHCKFWWDNDQLSNAQWGILDILNNWNVAANASCNGNMSANDVKRIIDGTLAVPRLTLRVPPPTYVCATNGFQGNSLTNAIQQEKGKLVVMPVNDPNQQVQSNGSLCTPGSSCTVSKYAIIGFAILEINDAAMGQQAKTLCPGHTGNNGSVRCLDMIWRGYVTSNLEIGGGSNFGVAGVAITR